MTGTDPGESTGALRAGGATTTPNDRLASIARIAETLNAGDIARDAQALLQRLEEGRAYVAVLGQFKRGKSTLLNALVGARVLPVGVLPVTSVVTVVRHGPRASAVVRLRSGDRLNVSPEGLAAYVSELENPGNAKGVEAVEVFVPAPLLAEGMCLIDTPGVGSTYDANTEATRDFLPHLDAAILVVGADPPLSGEECTLAADATRRVADLIVVLNKADRVSAEDIETARGFTTRTLTDRIGRDPGPVYVVSAAERLQGTGPPRDWEALLARLRQLSHEGRAAILLDAARRGTTILAARVLAEIAERKAALTGPIEASEARLANLAGVIDDARRAAGDLSYLFVAEGDRLHQAFEVERLQFVEGAVANGARELKSEIATAENPRRGLRERLMKRADSLAEHDVVAWMEGAEPRAEQALRNALARYVQMAEKLLDRLRAAERPDAPALAVDLPQSTGFRARRRFYFDSFASSTPSSRLSDLVRSKAALVARVEVEAVSHLHDLIDRNSVRATNDLDQRIEDTWRAVLRDVHRVLDEVLAASRRAASEGKRLRAEGDDAVRDELARLEAIELAARATREIAVEGVS